MESKNLENWSLPHLSTQYGKKLDDSYLENHILHMAIDEPLSRKKYKISFNQNVTHWYEIWQANKKSIVFDGLFPINLRHILIFRAS